MGRLVLSGRELTRLAGFTARVTEMISVLDDLNEGKYSRTMVKFKEEGDEELENKSNRQLAELLSENQKPERLLPNSGTIEIKDFQIKFEVTTYSF